VLAVGRCLGVRKRLDDALVTDAEWAADASLPAGPFPRSADEDVVLREP
jgi:hypothetical protein